MFKRFKMKTAVAPDLKQFIGRKVNIPGLDSPVTISHICPNKGLSLAGDHYRPTFYEVNGEHLIGMLRFHAQMLGDKSITEEQFQAFENMDFHAEKVSDQKTVMEVQ